MYSIRVVPGLDVFEYRKCSLEPGSVLFVIYPFHLEILEEAFGHRIVPAVTFPAHAAFNQSISLKKSPELITGILDPPVGVEDQLPG